MARANNTASNHSTAAPASRFSLLLFDGPRDIVGPRILLILAVAALIALGLVMVYSSSMVEAIDNGNDTSYYLLNQLKFLIIGLILCIIVARFLPYHFWHTKALDVIWVLSMITLLLTVLVGTSKLGAQRWLEIGSISFQPSEFAKIAVILMAARIMDGMRSGEYDFKTIAVRTGVCVLLPVLAIYATQSDLGTTIICVIGIAAVLWIAEIPVKVIAAVFVVTVICGLIAVFGVGYRSDRLSFINPEADYYGSGYQLTHSFFAFGEGGLFGVGLGNSAEKYLYLPEAETDFIFAIVGEELGLVGALVVVALFLVVLYAGIRIARHAPDLFGAMVAGSCTVILVFQAFMNIFCVVGLLPTTGKPLPFISSGGSSLVVSLLLVGLILSVSFGSDGQTGVYAHRRADLRVVRSEGRTPIAAANSAARRSSSATAKASDSRRRNTPQAAGRSRNSAQRDTRRSRR